MEISTASITTKVTEPDMPIGKLGLRVLLLLSLLCATVVCLPRLLRPVEQLAPLRLGDCVLPCWIGIVPGETLIAEASARVQAVYDSQHYEIQLIEPQVGYTFAYRLRITHKTQGRSLLVIFNAGATQLQTETSLVHQIGLYPQGANRELEPAVIDMLLFLGSPSCLAVAYDSYTAWPLLVYPSLGTIVNVGTVRLEIAPNLRTSLELTDGDVRCQPMDIRWTGIRGDYRAKLIESILP